MYTLFEKGTNRQIEPDLEFKSVKEADDCKKYLEALDKEFNAYTPNFYEIRRTDESQTLIDKVFLLFKNKDFANKYVNSYKAN